MLDSVHIPGTANVYNAYVGYTVHKEYYSHYPLQTTESFMFALILPYEF